MKIGIFGQFFYPDSTKYIQQLLEVFEEEAIDVWFEGSFFDLMNEKGGYSVKNLNCFTKLDTSFDLFFCVGGDGTILAAVKFVKDLGIPIVGINTGRLGFLASVHKDEIQESIREILKGNYQKSERSLLEVNITPSGELKHDFAYALNEISISRKDTTSMITVETWLDSAYLNSYWSDGVIVATPTGSTGYSMSCGGPIIMPDTASIVLTPIAPHNLNARPLVIPDNKTLKFQVKGREDKFILSLDSRLYFINKSSSIYIKKAAFTIQLIALPDQSFIETLREKLLWGEDSRNLMQ